MSRLYNKTRKQNNRVSKPVIYVATEGTVTEPQYFKKLKDLAKDFVSIQVVDSRSQTHCDPKSVLKRLKNELKSKDSFESRDRAWVVIDRDKWTKAAFNTLLDWEALDPRHGVALSNPKFEYWLLHTLTIHRGLRHLLSVTHISKSIFLVMRKRLISALCL